MLFAKGNNLIIIFFSYSTLIFFTKSRQTIDCDRLVSLSRNKDRSPKKLILPLLVDCIIIRQLKFFFHSNFQM